MTIFITLSFSSSSFSKFKGVSDIFVYLVLLYFINLH